MFAVMWRMKCRIGLNFADAYQTVKQKMGSRRLKEIQEETLYAVDTKYRFMKNTMKISGVAGTILFGFAALFKIQHWPLAGVLMTLGALDSRIYIPAFSPECSVERDSQQEETFPGYLSFFCRDAIYFWDSL